MLLTVMVLTASWVCGVGWTHRRALLLLPMQYLEEYDPADCEPVGADSNLLVMDDGGQTDAPSQEQRAQGGADTAQRPNPAV